MMGDAPASDGQTPIDDLSRLRPRWARTRHDLNELEAENIRKAHVKYLAARPSARLAPFTLAWLYRLHREMLGDVWTWAGHRRTTVKNIGVAPQQIEPQLHDLLLNLAAWRDCGMDLLEQATWLHYHAVRIHPFENGNGRWARLLANIWLKRHGHAIVRWPESDLAQPDSPRHRYLAALRAADVGDMAPLLAFHRRHLQA